MKSGRCWRGAGCQPPACMVDPGRCTCRRTVNGDLLCLSARLRWRNLPREYGLWQTVYVISDNGPGQIWTRLDARRRELGGRSMAAIRLRALRLLTADRSRRSWAGCAGLMEARNSSAANGTFWWTCQGFMLTGVVHPANIPDQRERNWCSKRCAGITSFAAHLGGSRLYRHPHSLDCTTPRDDAGGGSHPRFDNSSATRSAAAARPGVTRQASGSCRERWIVEPTFLAGDTRRMSKEYERLASTAEAFVYLVGIRLLLARLTRGQK